MKTARFSVEKSLCAECSLALRRFIGGMDGVQSIDAEQGRLVITYDDTQINDELLTTVTRDSVEKLGYRLEE